MDEPFAEQATTEQFAELLKLRDSEATIVKLFYLSHDRLMKMAKSHGSRTHYMAAWALELFYAILVDNTPHAQRAFMALGKEFLALKNENTGR